MDDQFPDENFLDVAVKIPWHEDVANYLAVGKLPRHLTSKERKLIVQWSARFSWIDGYIFHTGADVYTDASDKVIGAALGQEEDKKPYAIYYISKNLIPAELNYTITEKDFLAVIYAINKF